MASNGDGMIKRGVSMDGMNVRQALRIYCDLIAALRPFKSWAAIAAMLQDEGVRPITGTGPIQARTLSTYWRQINAAGMVDPARSGSISEAMRAQLAKMGQPDHGDADKPAPSAPVFSAQEPAPEAPEPVPKAVSAPIAPVYLSRRPESTLPPGNFFVNGTINKNKSPDHW